MGLGSLFSSSSSSSQSTKVNDGRVGADNGGLAFRQLDNNKIVVGSDETAQFAINSTLDALTASTDFIGDQLTSFFNITDRRFTAADNNIQSQNALTAELLKSEQESSDDRLIQIIKYALLAGVGYTVIKSGAVNQVIRAFK